MAVSIEDIKKLRHMTGAGMMDCKNALAETNGDIDAAIEIIRKKRQLVFDILLFPDKIRRTHTLSGKISVFRKRIELRCHGTNLLV